MGVARRIGLAVLAVCACDAGAQDGFGVEQTRFVWAEANDTYQESVTTKQGFWEADIDLGLGNGWQDSTINVEEVTFHGGASGFLDIFAGVGGGSSYLYALVTSKQLAQLELGGTLQSSGTGVTFVRVTQDFDEVFKRGTIGDQQLDLNDSVAISPGLPYQLEISCRADAAEFFVDSTAGATLVVAFWILEEPCRADCDDDDDADLFDFLCFTNLFVEGDAKSDCNGDETLDLFDFLCFVTEFNECP